MPTVSKQTRKVTKSKTGALSRLASAWDMTSTFSMLLYGKSGTGKTVFWSSFPGPILCMVCSGGQRPGELRSVNTPAMRKKITAKVVGESTDVKELISLAGDFATVVLDHGSGMQDLILKEVLGIEELPAQKSWGMASQSQYGQCSLQTKTILRELLSLDCYRVIVAQERQFDGEEDNEAVNPHVCAAMTPSVVGWLGPACDYVCQTYIRPKMEVSTVKVGKKQTTQSRRGKGVEFCLRTAPHDIFATKFRVPRGIELPECIVDPTFDKVKTLTEGG